ncbi:MAG TPA: hypothetical protein VLM91_27335 [Candidatus Methylomirabilis sp.]|nr:hypothetical protein [Candidatus Methylomirabilis sp.]
MVAAFVGQVNLLRAIVDAGGVRPGRLTFPMPPEAPQIEPGREVLLALRPEGIRIGAGSLV